MVYIWAVLLLNNTPKHSKPKKLHSNKRNSQTANIPTKVTVKSKTVKACPQANTHSSYRISACSPSHSRKPWATAVPDAVTGSLVECLQALLSLTNQNTHSGTPLSKPPSKDWLVGWTTCVNAELSLKRSLVGTEIPGGGRRGRLYLTPL